MLSGLLCATLPLAAAPRPPHRVVYIAQSIGAATRSWWAEQGFADGRDVEFLAAPLAAASPERMEASALEILRARPSVVMLPGWDAVFLFTRLTREVPLVLVNFGGDPVGMGLVRSLRRPGGNVTGSAQNLMSMTPKIFELVREFRPGGGRGAVLVTETTSRARHMGQGAQEIARSASLLGMDIATVVVPDNPRIAALREAIERARVDYLFVTDEFHPLPVLRELVAYVERARIPTIYISRQVVRDGGLVSFTPDVAQGRRNAVEIAARILRGDNPATIPVFQTDRYHVTINRRTARAMGIEVPAALLARADEVVD